MRKYDIVNAFAPRNGEGRYLEICTPSTGLRFAQVDSQGFSLRHRLMYRCPEGFDDGLPITFRTSSDGAHDILRTLIALQAPDMRYDVIFVDPWHGYSAGVADMHAALALLRPDGIMVVHDCNPTDPDTVQPEYRDGAWCGVTYQAFIDVVLSAKHGGYCTVDCDYGCGVVFGPARAPPDVLPHGLPGQAMLFEWALAREGEASRWGFFDRNRRALLNLVSPTGFLDALDLAQPEPAAATDVPDLSSPPGYPDTTLKVRVNDAVLPLQGYERGWHRYVLPPGTRDVHIGSPTHTPADEDATVGDRRRLGVALGGVRLDTRSIDLADAVLAEGWHSEEAGAGYPWRWSDGDSRLRLPDGVSELELYTIIRREAAPAAVTDGPPVSPQ